MTLLIVFYYIIEQPTQSSEFSLHKCILTKTKYPLNDNNTCYIVTLDTYLNILYPTEAFSHYNFILNLLLLLKLVLHSVN